jgi:hypothetical protein
MSDFVDFSSLSMQKFDKYEIENDKLILIKDNNRYIRYKLRMQIK